MSNAPAPPVQMSMAEYLIADALREIADDHGLAPAANRPAPPQTMEAILDQMARAAIATLAQWDFSR